MKTMEHHDNSNLISIIFGVIGGLIVWITNHSFLFIDWQIFFEDIFTGVIKAIVFGTIGGAAGYFGKKFIEKHISNKKKKDY